MTGQTRTYKHPKLWWVAEPFAEKGYYYIIEWSSKKEIFVPQDLHEKHNLFVVHELLALWFLPEEQVMGEQEGEKKTSNSWREWNKAKEERKDSLVTAKLMYESKPMDLWKAVAYHRILWQIDAITIIDEFERSMPKPTEGCNVSPSVDENTSVRKLYGNVNWIYNLIDSLMNSEEDRKKYMHDIRGILDEEIHDTWKCKEPSVDIESIAKATVSEINLMLYKLRLYDTSTKTDEKFKMDNFMESKIKEILQKHLGTSVSTPPSKVDDFINSKNRIVKAYLDFKKMQKWKQYLENECGAFGRAIYECMPTPPSKVREETI